MKRLGRHGVCWAQEGSWPQTVWLLSGHLPLKSMRKATYQRSRTHLHPRTFSRCKSLFLAHDQQQRRVQPSCPATSVCSVPETVATDEERRPHFPHRFFSCSASSSSTPSIGAFFLNSDDTVSAFTEISLLRCWPSLFSGFRDK